MKIAQIGKDNKGFQGTSSDGDSGDAAGAEGRIRANPRLKKHLEPVAWEMSGHRQIGLRELLVLSPFPSVLDTRPATAEEISEPTLGGK